MVIHGQSWTHPDSWTPRKAGEFFMEAMIAADEEMDAEAPDDAGVHTHEGSGVQ